jgi:16S rRNA (guanine(966)-N(2))-methyltransferase RsmD
VRIISGKLKARRFSVPKNFPSRPTTDFAKEGLFNLLGNQIELDGIKVLDLCSGTGNISFEFISRGASHVTAVDQNFNCVRFIRKNAESLQIDTQIQIVKSDILGYLRQCSGEFDLIFADPPYEITFHQEIAEIIFQRNLLSPEGMLIIEHGKKTDLSSLTHFGFSRTYGNVHFSFFNSEPQTP